MCVFFLDKLSKAGILISSLSKYRISVKDMIFNTVLIGLGVGYFDTMCATVNSHFLEILKLRGFDTIATIWDLTELMSNV